MDEWVIGVIAFLCVYVFAMTMVFMLVFYIIDYFMD